MLLIGVKYLHIGKNLYITKSEPDKNTVGTTRRKTEKQSNGVKQDAFFMCKIIILQNGITQTVNQPPETAVFCYSEKAKFKQWYCRRIIYSGQTTDKNYRNKHYCSRSLPQHRKDKNN